MDFAFTIMPQSWVVLHELCVAENLVHGTVHSCKPHNTTEQLRVTVLLRIIPFCKDHVRPMQFSTGHIPVSAKHDYPIVHEVTGNVALEDAFVE